jgi:hypothetical protein
MLILVAVGLCFMIQNAMTNTLIQAAVPDNLRGRVMSVYTYHSLNRLTKTEFPGKLQE